MTTPYTTCKPRALPSHADMTLRDYFAGQALAGLMAQPTRPADIRETAFDAYAYADAMLAERAKGEQGC